MRYVPSFPPPVTPVDTNGVKSIDHARPVRAVTQSVTPPIVFTHYRVVAAMGEEERVVERRFRIDRRAICRRIDNERDKLLLDSRAVLERRRNNRRQADVRTNIDEEI